MGLLCQGQPMEGTVVGAQLVSGPQVALADHSSPLDWKEAWGWGGLLQGPGLRRECCRRHRWHSCPACLLLYPSGQGVLMGWARDRVS